MSCLRSRDGARKKIKGARIKRIFFKKIKILVILYKKGDEKNFLTGGSRLRHC